jgi:hypothetical protein
MSQQSRIVDELENQRFSSLGNSALIQQAEASGFRAGVSDISKTKKIKRP